MKGDRSLVLYALKLGSLLKNRSFKVVAASLAARS